MASFAEPDVNDLDSDADVDAVIGAFAGGVVVTPGEVVTAEGGFLRGHGTYIVKGDADLGRPDKLVASVAGVVERVNKLVSVRPLRRRYHAEVGDVVVGRVVEVGQKRWKVDVNAPQHAVMLLSSVILPGP